MPKISVSRLEPFLSNWISLHQFDFIPGLNIQDNIILVQEMIYSITSISGRKCYMFIKIDLAIQREYKVSLICRVNELNGRVIKMLDVRSLIGQRRRSDLDRRFKITSYFI